MMERARQSMLEIAKYIAIKKGSVEESCMTNDKQRVIFQTSTTNFPLYQLGIYVTSDSDDTLLLEEIRLNIMRDNTLGADALDKVSIMTSTSIGQMYDKFKDIQEEKQKAEEQRQQQEMAQQQQMIQARQAEAEMKMKFEREQLLLELESREKQSEFRALGSSQFAQGNGIDEITKLRQVQLKEDTFYQSILEKAQANQLKKEQLNTQSTSNDLSREQEDSLEREKLKVEREKIMAKLKVSKNELEVAKVNK